VRVLIDEKEGVTLLRFDGGDALEYGMADQVRQQALAAIDGNADVVVDMSGIQFVDSAGLGVLVSLFKAARREGRRARFAGVHPEVNHVLEIIRLDSILDFSPDVDSAVEALRRL
jgi:anti-sigma B factor antagonist